MPGFSASFFLTEQAIGSSPFKSYHHTKARPIPAVLPPKAVKSGQKLIKTYVLGHYGVLPRLLEVVTMFKRLSGLLAFLPTSRLF
jgi:hypothetical protein